MTRPLMICAATIVGGWCASAVSAQTITPTFRTGNNFVGCGDVFTGPRITHSFSAFISTHDPISVSDSGSGIIPASSASSTYDSTLTPSSIAISLGGNAVRGAPAAGGNTSAFSSTSASDQWSFTVSQTTCFTLDMEVTFSTSTGDGTVGQGVQLGVDGNGDLALDDGSHPGILAATIDSINSITRHYSGTIAAGSYFIANNGQANGNGAPRNATYHHSITLRIGAEATGTPATVSPAVSSACAGQAAGFSVPSAAGATYQWQIETAPGVWQTLGNDPAPLPCGGGTGGFAYASPINSPAVNIGVHPCNGGSAAYRVRCIVSNGCAAAPSNPATLFVEPADIGQGGGAQGRDGIHDNNDFIAFINAFFNRQPAADLGSQGGVLGDDGLFDNNDFIVFINLFFAAC